MKFQDMISLRYLAHNVIVPALSDSGFKKIANNIKSCGEYIDYALCSSCYTNHYNGFSSCKQRYCPICAKKRSLLYFSRFCPVIRELINKGYYVNGLNFTLVNTNNLKNSIEVINSAFRILQHDDKNFSKEFNRRFIGGVRCLEVKVGVNEKLWHPHLHCLVVKDKFERDIEFLQSAWNHAVKLAGGQESKTTPGLYGLVSIFSLKDKKNLNSSTEKSIEIGCLETLKYITKFDYELDGKLIPELIPALNGVRCINTWGILRKINTDIEEDMNKTYTEIREQCCSNCGATDFIEFVSKRVYKDIKDFDENNFVISGLKAKDKSSLVELAEDLVVGQLYDGVMFTERHKHLIGKRFNVIFEKGKYILHDPSIEKIIKTRYRVFVNSKIDENKVYRYELHSKHKVHTMDPIIFSQSMLVFYLDKKKSR